jgi:hypothetical protein
MKKIDFLQNFHFLTENPCFDKISGPFMEEKARFWTPNSP